MSPEPIEIGLLWHTFGHANLGVDALARGHAHLLLQAAAQAGRPIRLISLGAGQNGEATALPVEVSIGPSPAPRQILKGDFSFIRGARSCDMIFDIGEGDSFTDIYGGRRFILQIGTKMVAMSRGKPLYLAPQTIGPFDHPVRRRIAIAAMRRVAGIFTRDGLSTGFLQSNGLVSKSSEFIDVAFALPFSRQDKAGDRVRIGLNVSGLLYRRGYTGRNELGMAMNYADFTHQLIEVLLARVGVEIHLISHVHGPDIGPDNDAPVLRELATRYPNVHTAPLFRNSIEAKSYLSGMDFVIGGRMHACIGAFSAGVPVVPIAYSRKFNGLFGTLGYDDYVDGKACTTEEALARVLGAFEKRDELATHVQKGLTIVEQRLSAYIKRLTEIISEH